MCINRPDQSTGFPEIDIQLRPGDRFSERASELCEFDKNMFDLGVNFVRLLRNVFPVTFCFDDASQSMECSQKSSDVTATNTLIQEIMYCSVVYSETGVISGFY